MSRLELDTPSHISNIRGIPKDVLLEELLLNAVFAYDYGGDPPEINMEEAWYIYEMAEAQNTGLRIVCGRCLGIDIRFDEVSSLYYDSYNGEGKCRELVERLRQEYPLDP
ncbi:hypothetical protein BDV28DRAFT_147335 [Aspergillus coremiiformis]|uniref:Uncharacterized protein n=1 Tax=Aspergillus coremiiformis TaxID=138285 RepID=A0A5N6Z9R6_9EURO|nr:hypothetical protein BDV28DRAFT_147335 [Aspergillus coremiiformis]